MKISYDPAKNERNIMERGLPFEEVEWCEWRRAIYYNDNRKNYGEIRTIAYLPYRERLHCIVFTARKDVMHVISFRKANERERRWYDTQTRSGND